MNELESYALDVSDKTFRPLMEFDIFYLSLITSNQNLTKEFVRDAVEKWHMPTEDEHILLDIDQYAPTLEE